MVITANPEPECRSCAGPATPHAAAILSCAGEQVAQLPRRRLVDGEHAHGPLGLRSLDRRSPLDDHCSLVDPDRAAVEVHVVLPQGRHLRPAGPGGRHHPDVGANALLPLPSGRQQRLDLLDGRRPDLVAALLI